LASNCARGARDGFDADFCAMYLVKSFMACLSCASSGQYSVGISFGFIRADMLIPYAR
jgi:hypothetical protein